MSIWFVAVLGLIQHVVSAKTMKKMCCTPSGLARASQRFGMRTHSGIHSKAHTTVIFAQLLAAVFASDCSLALFAFITRTIWLKRNKVRFSPPGFPIDQVMQRATAALMEFRTMEDVPSHIFATYQANLPSS
nr:hypothetical protein CFP56_38228 [Quercus suber]